MGQLVDSVGQILVSSEGTKFLEADFWRIPWGSWTHVVKQRFACFSRLIRAGAVSWSVVWH